MADPDFNMLGLKFSGSEIGMALAGFFGSLISLKFMGAAPWYERLTWLAGGCVSSQYLTPGIQHFLGFYDAPYFVVFLAGAFGMSVMAAVFHLAKNPAELLRLILNRPK